MDCSTFLQFSGSGSFVPRQSHRFFCHGESLSISLISHAGFYQVLEYMGGGDLLNLLIERDVFEEDFTRFYAAEVSTYRPFTTSVPGYRPSGL